MLYYRQYILNDAAPWVVFVHGAGGSSAVWFKQLKDFKQHFNLLLVDLRGHGKSVVTSPEKQRDNYSFEVIANDIIEVLDYLKLKKAHFIGVSLGTLIVRQLGYMIAHRVDSMILVGAITHFNFKSRFGVAVARKFKNILPYMWLYRLFAYVILPQKNHQESRNIFIAEAQKLCKREFLRWFKLTSQMASLFDKFETHFAIPTLYVMGDQDHMFLNPIKNMVEKLKNSVLIVIEECGHVVNIEKAHIFNAQAISYIQNVGCTNNLK